MTPSRIARVVAAIALLAALAACAGRFGGQRADLPGGHETAPTNEVPGLSHLGRVDDGLWRCAQPSANGFRRARELGIKTVVDLRGAHDDEASLRALGLELVSIRTSAKHIDEEDLLAFLRVAIDPAKRPVLVHCAAGHDRTGAAVAAYRRVVSGWSADDALSEMRAFGAAPWYQNLVALIRNLDVERMRSSLGLTAPPSAPRSGAPTVHDPRAR